jgi:Cytochrome c7 and related cytochrome c
MSQIFPRKANALARSSLAVLLSLGLTAVWLVYVLMFSSWATKQNEFVEQPIQFSHAHHVGGVGLDCRYCHTSVEKSSFAGIPPTKTCMNCHAQLWNTAPILEPVRASFRNDSPLTWIRVNDLPDFVYFNHQIHVKQGVGCVTCHGPVDKMALMYQAESLLMSFCLNCHRAPENFLRPREEVFNVAYEPPRGDRPVVVRTGAEQREFRSQLELGRYLKEMYRVSSIEHMTSCSVCHR